MVGMQEAKQLQKMEGKGMAPIFHSPHVPNRIYVGAHGIKVRVFGDQITKVILGKSY
jgi:hypothetical protein